MKRPTAEIPKVPVTCKVVAAQAFLILIVIWKSTSKGAGGGYGETPLSNDGKDRDAMLKFCKDHDLQIKLTFVVSQAVQRRIGKANHRNRQVGVLIRGCSDVQANRTRQPMSDVDPNIIAM